MHSWTVVLLLNLGADPDDFSARVITPSQILIGRNLQAYPTKDTRVSEQTSRALTKRFQYHQKLVNGFWKQWHAEYLKSLTPLKKWYKFGHEIRKGDLVLVSEDRVARVSVHVHEWKIPTQAVMVLSGPLPCGPHLEVLLVVQCSGYTCLKPVMLT